jgi:hypothetical protein
MLKDGKKLNQQELMDKVKTGKGKTGGWPNYFGYFIDGDSITISAENKILDKKATRRLDPWGLAFLIEAKSQCGIQISTINFAISGEIEEIKPNGRLVPDLEAFRRRVSFLSINNKSLRFHIAINGENLELDDLLLLFNRPDAEKTHGSVDRKDIKNVPGRLEKDFQSWLFASGVTETNERLAVLGDDFIKLKNRGYEIIREFPTGAFYEKISNNRRILPTEFVDIVTLNKYGQLSVIELKLNDSQLEVIAQILDYSLYFRCYRENLLNILEKKWKTPKSKEIICYVVNNYFHKRFDELMKFYSTKNGSYGFKIIKVLLGHYEE